MSAETVPVSSDRATIVCCVERGRLEQETLIMLESLRAWGGPLGRSRVLAVMPRRDRRLSRETIAGLESFGAEVHDGSRLNRMTWYNWYGKVVAALVAEEVATTPVIIWLDSDLLIFGPLEELGLPHGDDLTARRETLPPAVMEGEPESSPFIAHWRHACETVGVDWADVPWLPAEGGRPRQRMTFNAGINAFRRGLGFPQVYQEFTDRLMKARVSYLRGSFWHNEQHAVVLAMVKLGMKFRELCQAENHMVFDCQIDGEHAAPPITDARIVHYGRSMNEPYWPRFLERARRERPELHAWLASRGPIRPEAGLKDPVFLARKVYRRLYAKYYAKRCIGASEAWHASRPAFN